MNKRKLALLVLCVSLIIPAFCQVNDPYYYIPKKEVKNNGFRKFLNKFSFTLTGGYGRTFYKHHLPGYGVVNYSDSIAQGLYLFAVQDSTNSPFTGYQNWLNAPSVSAVNRFANSDQNNQVLSDTARLGYKGSAGAIPFTFTLSIRILDHFIIGGGITYEIHRLPVMNPMTGEELIGKYVPNVRSTHLRKYFGTVGGKVYEYMGWSYYVDLQIGKIAMGGAYDKASISNSLFFNLGLPIEYEFSEYLSAVIRPSFEYKSYKVVLPEIGGAVKHTFPSLYVSIGFRYRIPEIPRCPIHARTPTGYDYPKKFTNKTCRIQKKHVHVDREFRGQPFYKKQNPKIGENHPTLFRYHWYNKRKISGGY